MYYADGSLFVAIWLDLVPSSNTLQQHFGPIQAILKGKVNKSHDSPINQHYHQTKLKYNTTAGMLYGTIIVAMEAMSESFDDKILPSKMVFNDCNANFMLRDSPHMVVHVLVTEGSISPAPNSVPGARPTKHISIEFEIRWKFRML